MNWVIDLKGVSKLMKLLPGLFLLFICSKMQKERNKLRKGLLYQKKKGFENFQPLQTANNVKIKK